MRQKLIAMLNYDVQVHIIVNFRIITAKIDVL